MERSALVCLGGNGAAQSSAPSQQILTAASTSQVPCIPDGYTFTIPNQPSPWCNVPGAIITHDTGCSFPPRPGAGAGTTIGDATFSRSGVADGPASCSLTLDDGIQIIVTVRTCAA